ncbi:serine/threonine-protein phosphatase alpha-2 isoform-like [Scaptodrosophila lebanonensis]|uniref:Serine/threonine-protein phosphatase n=1 Tax=Drosophila lebanonensis TaxID=7225 RepID=A0A6J2TBS4_DROLE|nr:serine/threonine-protein phosphatase alpha-2 isoform-like [Scaptodrosophila lebanonensis]
MLSQPKIDDMIRLLEGGFRQRSRFIKLLKEDINAVCAKARDIFLSQPMCLRLSPPICIVGDLHGQFEDLLRILKSTGTPPEKHYLFLGNYVDRGQNSIETITLLLCYKIKYPDCVFMLRGNHESQALNRIHGFHDECQRRYSHKLWLAFVACYSCMPVCAVVGEKIFCCHGGLSPHLLNIDQINKLKRPTDVSENSLLCDLLWADPDRMTYGWRPNCRGVSVTFGRDIVDRFLARHHFELICRGHQVVEDGFEYFARRQLITIFSAPKFCGKYDNHGATMHIDENMLIAFDLYAPLTNSSTNLNRNRSSTYLQS